MTRRQLLWTLAATITLTCWSPSFAFGADPTARPNILFCIADDWGWPHAGVHGDPVVKTPTFDRLAREGVMFEYAYVSTPSCTPSRNAILTGQQFYRLGVGASLAGTLDVKHPVYPLLLAEAGYHIGHWRKCWGPGSLKPGGYGRGHPHGTGYRRDGFKAFLAARPKGKPFCFWLGTSDPHRPYKKGSGVKSGIDLAKVPVPKFYPDAAEIRSDIADYYVEVQRFDSDCAAAVKMLEEIGELDNTIIVMTGDHGMPFPRCKANLYEMGVRVPLAVRWGAKVKGGRRITDFVSLTDLAPTFLAVAGVPVPDTMTGRSLVPAMTSAATGRVEAARDHVLFGRERHVPAQKFPSMAGYPARAIRTDRHLYIRNYAPDRWPAGSPADGTFLIKVFSDCDRGPTKDYLVANRDNPKVRFFYDLAFAKRPAEELYDLKTDPGQLVNLAGKPAHAKIQADLAARLTAGLKRTGDPRETGGPAKFDDYPFYMGNFDKVTAEYKKQQAEKK